MTEAMPFLQKTILLSYDPRPFGGELFVLPVLSSGSVGRGLDPSAKLGGSRYAAVNGIYASSANSRQVRRCSIYAVRAALQQQ